MARDRVFPRGLAQVHPRYLTPFKAILLQGAIASACVFMGDFDALTDSVVFAAWIFYFLAVASLFIFRRRGGEPPFRMPGYPLLPAFFVVFAGAFVIYNAWDSAFKVEAALGTYSKTGQLDFTGLTPLISLAIILAGVPVYAWFRSRAEVSPHHAARVEELEK
jgi:APA family basic amino acid/polyamine antiporter